MAKKKSCYGCRALCVAACILGYPVKTVYNEENTYPTPIPMDSNCPKPLTYRRLVELQEKAKK